MRRIFFFIIALCLGCGTAAAQAQDTLFISSSQTVHLRFASELKYVNLGNRSIVARIVDGSKDFVAVKAREAFESVTSMSCLEVTGAMHTFLVAYREAPGRLEVDTRQTAAHNGTGYSGHNSTGSGGSASVMPGPTSSVMPGVTGHLPNIASLPQELYHLCTRGYGIDIRCENILVKDDALYLVLSLKNGSAVSYDLSAPRFAIESKRRTRRGLQYEKAIFPKQAYGLGVVAPGATGKLVFAFDKVALTRGQVLRLYFYENSGSRNFVLTLGARDIEGARRMNLSKDSKQTLGPQYFHHLGGSDD